MAPKWHELGVSPTGGDSSDYGFHCKDVPPICRDRLVGLPAHDPAIREKLVKALAWLTDARLYAGAESTVLERCRLPPDNLATQLSRRKIERTLKFKGTCKSFRVPEHAKRRYRAIQHPAIANKVTANAESVKFASTAQRHAAVLRGRWSIDIDFAAFYDQFELDEAVREYFCFLRGANIYRMVVLPMGLKQSVSVAQCASDHLANFDTPVYREVYIDNIRMVDDDKDAVVRCAAQLLVRCAIAGVTVNEVDVRPLAGLSPEDAMAAAMELAAPLAIQQGDWLGESYDYVNKTVALSQKTRAKVERCLDAGGMTFRNLAAAFGILQHASRTAGLRLAKYYPARRLLSCIGRLLSGHDHLWDALIPPIRPAIIENLKVWRDDCLRAGHRVVLGEEPAQLTLITDASDTGFGCISIDEMGREAFLSSLWTDADRHANFTAKSSRAEPEAVLRSARRFVRHDVHKVVAIHTDSSTAVGALAKGHSSSYWVNGVCARLQAEFPKVRFVLTHLPGDENPADKLSRGRRFVTPQEWESARRIADVPLVATAG